MWWVKAVAFLLIPIEVQFVIFFNFC